MRKDAERTEAKSNEIVTAALELFFENGYEGTSIHMIQQKIGKKVTGFYYYFSSKDAVFKAAIDLFFKPYENQMRIIVDCGKEKTDRVLTKYLDYINDATQEFRAQYLKTLHWSILGAIREHTMLIMKKYIREILENYLENGILSSLEVDIEVAVNFLAFGVGGSILYQNGEKYNEQRVDTQNTIAQLLGLSKF